MKPSSQILAKGQVVDGKYCVAFFLKKGSYAETYRVKDNSGKTKFLKLFDFSKLHRSQFDQEQAVLEIKLLKQVQHPNLVRYNDDGVLFVDNRRFAYVILDFISGETLANRLTRDEYVNEYEARDIILGVANGVLHLHSLEEQVIHNDISNLNVMLDLSGNTAIPKLIDFGYARYLKQSRKDFLQVGLNPFYQANETFNGVFSLQSDVFSVGALFYHLVEGLPPWFIEVSKYKSDPVALQDALIQERTKRLSFKNLRNEDARAIIVTALAENLETRFESISEFVKAMNGERNVQRSSEVKKVNVQPKKAKGGGFAAVAGMQQLKDLVQTDVIDALNNKERYAEYGITIPNGMLLYGPPGCGKTFFAERMAEEIGFDFYQLKPSDIQSKFVNESQEKIKDIFNKARENAPSVIFIDELDAVVPNRDTANMHQMNSSAVNEFLAQMNNCGEDGIFMIGATNRPVAIDPAILRPGRLDKIIYLPPPDLVAREAMFRIYLEKRPSEVGLDYAELAVATENFVSSDIKFLCDEASRKALKSESRITREILMGVIQHNRPSISLKELKKYESIKAEMDGSSSPSDGLSRIGFKIGE